MIFEIEFKANQKEREYGKIFIFIKYQYLYKKVWLISLFPKKEKVAKACDFLFYAFT